MFICQIAVVIILILANFGDADFVGYNVTSSAASNEGQATIILEGLPLMVDVVTGFYVSMATANCLIKLQIWRRDSYLHYVILYQREYQSTISGFKFIPLSESEQFLISAGDKIGFTSLDAASSCVTFKVVTDVEDNALTLAYSFSGGPPPSLGIVYTFDNYKRNYVFGIGISVKYGSSRNRQFVLAGTTRVIGYNVSTTRRVSISQATILLEGLELTEGNVTGYYVWIPVPNCPIRLQIWRPTTGRVYSLLGDIAFESSDTGYFYVPSLTEFEVTGSDRLGFTTLAPSTSCVPYLFVSNSSERSQTLFHFTSGSPPQEGDIYSFNPLQTTFLFAVAVEVKEGTLLLPGPTGQDGLSGPDGIVGVKGIAGERGDLGGQGFPGLTGIQGGNGSGGIIGINGIPGDQGRSGSPGQDGANGIAGVRGDVGATGSTGVKGPTGTLGDQGLRGSNGVKGDGGIVGEKGDTGPSFVGDTGDTGHPGLVGIRGPKGGQGDDGSAGSDGYTGSNGVDGENGVRGPMWASVDHCKEQNVSCAHGCENHGHESKCTCRNGFQLVDEFKCLDIDECSDMNGLCQQDCINTDGSFHCACPHGLKLSLDNQRCNDVDECSEGPRPCSIGQTCINQFGEYLCIGSPTQETLALSFAGLFMGMPLVTRHVMIGLVIWLILLTLLTLMAVILIIPELSDKQRKCPKNHIPQRVNRSEFYYPAFFPRITLDRPTSGVYKGDLDTATTISRRASIDETNVAQEELYAHVGRAHPTDMEKKTTL